MKNNVKLMKSLARLGHGKWKSALRCTLLILGLLAGANVAKAQTRANDIRMKTGNEVISDAVPYNFYDSGGPYIMEPEEDPNNDYNWVTWYQHDESYLLHLVKPAGFDTKGIKIVFNYLLINDDHLMIYEGDLEDPDKLIVDLTNNDYSTGYGSGYTVMSHGNMTIRFTANYHWRDAGWDASVMLYDYTPQPPVAVMEACDNLIYLLPGSMSANGSANTKMVYTTDGTTPSINVTNGSILNGTEYTAPFRITAATTVKAILVENGTTSSTVSTYTFNSLITPPDAPTIARVDGTNKVIITAPAVPAGQNDTYYVRYSIDGSNPQYSSLERAKADTIELTQPCTVKAVTRGTTCPDTFSEEASETYSTIYVPTPEINVTGTYNVNNGAGSGTITCSLSNATIYYTMDGTVPTTSSTNHGTSPVSLTSVPAGTTIKAMAHVEGSGYQDSQVATFVYIPTGDDNQPVNGGVFGSVVLLDDREDHDWSYYSDSTQPIHSLKPADVKITYYGYGPKTMTSTNTDNMPANSAFTDTVVASQVAVNVGEPANQFIYLKTLENANSEGSTGTNQTYPYTMIPNPFQVRPNNNTTTTPTERLIYINWGRGGTGGYTAATGTLEITYTNASGSRVTQTYTINSNTNTTITAKVGTTIEYSLIKTNTQTQNNRYVYFAARYDNSSGTQFITQKTCYSTTQATTGTSGSIAAPAPVTTYDWRGFYAWRVKSMSSGLKIKVNGTEYSSTQVSSIPHIYADQEIEFATDKAEGNEVEFEALWAKAYVNSDTYFTNSGNYQNAYERNFKVGNTITTYEYPVTFSTINPDGTGTAGSIALGTNYTCSNDVKFENITFTGGGNRTFNGAGYNFAFGRGVSGTIGTVYGSNSNRNINQTLRIENGTYTNLYGIGSSGPGNNMTKQHIILGCDYDRAESDDSNLSITNNIKLVISGNESVGTDRVKIIVKSGTFQNNTGSGTAEESGNCFYLWSPSQNNTGTGTRTMIVEGGQLWHIAGGLDCGNSASTRNLTIRIKGGTIRGSIFGGAARYDTNGYKYIIITGGTVRGWIAGGSNGFLASGNANTGNEHGTVTGRSYVYVGGDTYVGGREDAINMSIGGYVYGAGCGNTNTTTNAGSVTDQTNVVIADSAYVKHGVYGGGAYGSSLGTANVYVLGNAIIDGDDDDVQDVIGGVFGGARQKGGGTVNITMNGGTIKKGGLFGGSNATGTISGLATINMSGGTVTNVYGGGYGQNTVMAQNTIINVTGGTINNNVYGGGALGTVTGNTSVTFGGGTVKNVYGAGQGRAAATGVTAVTANIGGTTAVTISGGTVAESVYGGGEIGNVKQATNPTGSKDGEEGEPRAITAVSTVDITGGTIQQNVFGGGKEGYTNGGTVVNMSGGLVEGSVFGGALGLKDKVYVAGQRTVNMRGGTVNKHVYGGSRNADDALTFSPGAFASSNATETASVVNYAGGYTHYQVFASGYFGKVYGSTYAFIGTNAILNAPNHVAPSGDYNTNYYNQHTALRIGGSVWAGGDFGNYDGTKFGDPTITGRSNVYIDGEGYDTESNNTTGTNYMNIGGSVYGSGTSCDAGKQGRHIIIRNYGKLIEASQPTNALPYSSATRSLYSVQRADSLDIDNAHIVFLGEGKINSLVTTEKYSIHEFQKVRIDNGSSIFLNYPADQLKKFGSYKVNNVYNATPTYTPVTYETSSLEETPNKIRVNNGAYIQIKYVDDQNVAQYGELEGFAYMMSDDENNTCAYARPKQSTESGNIIPIGLDNPNDGGWVSYDATKNDYTIGGAPASESDQMRYENHTINLRNGEQYFRIWRAGGTYSYREGVFVAQSDGTSDYSTVDVLIDLPAFVNEDNCGQGATSFYRIKTLDGNTTIDYGNDVMLVNAACYDDVNDADWMFFSDTLNGFRTGKTQAQCSNLHYIGDTPNVNFGLVAIPQGGLAGDANMLICEASDAKIATMQWANTHNETAPQVRFRLTYNNNLTNNVVWDPITITFEQVSCDGETVLATVDVALTVTTLTSIDQDFITQAYAITRGTGTGLGSYTAKIVLPQYVMHVNTVGDISEWTCESVTFEPKGDFSSDLFVGGTDYMNPSSNVHNECNNKFGMTLVAGLNFDNTTGWDFYSTDQKNMYGWTDTDYIFGQTTARDPIGFDFTLLYDNRQKASGNYQVGTLTFKMKFTNYENAPGGSPYLATLNIKIEVWFLGQGANYYIDGVHGNNLYSGKYPNAAKKTLSGIYNRTDYHAGDYIFVVDTVTASGSNLLTWNGKAYDEVTLFRYPGGHECVPNATGSESHYEDYDLTTNAAYTGPLVVVESNMDMTGIVLDGFYKESQKEEGTAAGDITGHYHKYSPATDPLVWIKDGGRLSVYGSSRLENNYNNTTDGGGVYIENGGVLNLYDGSAVDTNFVATGKNGGGIYVNNTSKVQLSDVVNITGNQQISGNKAGEGTDNNVYLSTYDSHVDVGTADTDDPYTLLLSTAKVGITKNPDWGNYYYAPVAYSDGGQSYLGNLLTEQAPETGPIMWDDQTKYQILSLNSTHYSNPLNYAYFVGTWVTEVTSEPEGYSASAIDTPQELAWAISVASGYNGQTAAPGTTFTLTGDIDMNANIWVPIGSNGNAYTGTFNGNGHVVTGLRSPLNQENMGMFGSTNGATITDLVAQANFAGGTMKNVGAVIGSMNGGTLSNVEAAGKLTGTATTANIGGLVGEVVSGTIHSAFAVDTLTGGTNTVMGGLVGTNGADLYNSYSNVTMSGGATVGGIVGVNTGTIENCYNASETEYVFAGDNTGGTINYCYAAEGETPESDPENPDAPVEPETPTYVGSGNAPVGSGTYGA
ncbi:MAG: chitobiase/beta-hexosaminidase C-terminal domain-containing protein, partial [Bacteroidales bacterium]|nr:chitobiase/beta-hexosaminidase C-terminal domain-containing protein [Bacteroidales bacterium]